MGNNRLAMDDSEINKAIFIIEREKRPRLGSIYLSFQKKNPILTYVCPSLWLRFFFLKRSSSSREGDWWIFNLWIPPIFLYIHYTLCNMVTTTTISEKWFWSYYPLRSNTLLLLLSHVSKKKAARELIWSTWIHNIILQHHY